MTQFGKQYINTKCSVEGPNKTQTHRDSVLCEKCSGEGKIPWGGQPVSMEWDKKPLYLDIKTGLILDEGSVNSQAFYWETYTLSRPVIAVVFIYARLYIGGI